MLKYINIGCILFTAARRCRKSPPLFVRLPRTMAMAGQPSQVDAHLGRRHRSAKRGRRKGNAQHISGGACDQRDASRGAAFAVRTAARVARCDFRPAGAAPILQSAAHPEAGHSGHPNEIGAGVVAGSRAHWTDGFPDSVPGDRGAGRGERRRGSG